MNYKKLSFILVAILVVFGLGRALPAAATIARYVPSEYATIQAAIDAAQPGDIVKVDAGTYAGPITLKSGITLLGTGIDSTIIEGGSRGIIGWNGAATDVTITGFTIRNNGTPYVEGAGIDVTDSSNVTIENCKFYNNSAVNGGGVKFYHSSNVLVKNTIFASNTASNMGGALVLHNTVITLENITMADNTGGYESNGGISASGESNITVKNSIIYNNGKNLHIWGGSTLTATYSDIGEAVSGTGNINQNPLFAGGSNYHLQASSPGIDAGDPSSSYSKEPSPNGSRINMGAYGNTSGAASKTEARSITVTSPKAGDVWKHESTHNITWEATGADYIYIDVVCGTNAWTLFSSDVNFPASKGSYSWTVWPKLAGECYVRVFLLPGPSTGSPLPGVDFDMSDTFKIVEAGEGKFINVTSPNGGESWTKGNTYNIQWTSSGVENVHIDVVFYGSPSQAYTLVSNIPASPGSWSWTIGNKWPDLAAGKYKVRVFTYPLPASGEWQEGVNYDQSDYFKIFEAGPEPKPDLIISDISWTPVNPQTNESVSFQFIIKNNGGAAATQATWYIWYNTVNGTAGGLGNYTQASNGGIIYTLAAGESKTISAPYLGAQQYPNPGNYIVQAKVYNANPAESNPDNNIRSETITIASLPGVESIIITSPNHGEKWWVGKTYDITWGSEGVDVVDIWLVDEAQEDVQCSLSGICCSVCGNWKPIASNISASSGKYSWTIPTDQQMAGSMYKILVRTVPTNCFQDCPPADMSDYYFTIAEPGEGKFINVSSPNGGEEWWKGKTHNIHWAYSGIENVHIDVVGSSGAYTLVSNIPASKGYWPWTIGDKWPDLPAGVDYKTEYKIRIFTYPLPASGDWQEGVNYDQSDNYFSISEGREPLPPGEASVSGVITDYNNQPVAEAMVDIHTPDYTQGWGTMSDSEGNYSIYDVAPGTYIIDAYPPKGTTGLLRPYSIDVTLVEGGSIIQNFQFPEATKTIKGSVTLADATPVTDAVIKAVRNGKGWSAAISDPNGGYLLKVSGGDWEVHVYPQKPDTADWFYDQPYQQVSFADDKTHEEKIVNVVVSSKTVLPTKSGVEGIVLDHTGQPVERVGLVVFPPDHSFKRVSVTDSQGKYFISDLDPGTYVLEAFFPPDLGNFVVPDSRDISLLKGEVLTENFQLLEATKTITGKVSFMDGTLVTNVVVNAFKENAPGWAESLVDAHGNYVIKVGGGDWMVMPHPKHPDEANWSYNQPPKKVTFTFDQTREEAIVNFAVFKADARVVGKVLNSDGSVPQAKVIIGGPYGRGGEGELDSTGAFSIAVPAGNYTLGIHSPDPTLGAPVLDPFSVTSGQVLNLGTIYLIQKAEHIKGKVINKEGKGIVNVSVEAHQPAGMGFNRVQTDTFGNYDLYVTPGEWVVAAVPVFTPGYVYPEPPKRVTISSGETIILNFTLISADAAISGVVQGPTGNVLTQVYGWAFVEHEKEMIGTEPKVGPSGFGGPIERGTFSFNVPAGTYKVGIHLPPDADYSPGSLVPVTVGSGQDAKIVLTVRSNDATIKGYIKASSGRVITGIKLHVFVSGENGLWQEADINLSTGEYVIRISSGTWYLGYHVDPATGYISKPPIKDPIVVASGQTVIRDIILTKADSVISGKVTDSEGNPLAHVWISADSRSFEVKEEIILVPGEQLPDHFFANGAETDQNGNFKFPVPAGTYYIHAFLPPEFGYVNPEEQKVTVSPTAPGVITLIFRKTNSVISGKVYLDGIGISAFVWAWSEKGGFSETKADSTGSYKLKVANNDVWHIGAIKGIEEKPYKSDEVIIDLGDEDLVTEDLILRKLVIEIPEPISVTADATQHQVVSVEKGAEISIPANALTTSGNVTVSIQPELELPDQGLSKVVGVGYEVEARNEEGEVIETFNTNVTISLPYTEKELIEAKVNVDDLTIGFWDETAGVWRRLENTVIDKTNRLVIGIVNHFTRFAILAPADITPPSPPTAASVNLGPEAGSLVITWVNPTEDFYHSRIYRSEVSGELGSLVHDYLTEPAQKDTGLGVGTTYYYTVRAVDLAGNESTNTDQASGVPQATGVAPAGIIDGDIVVNPDAVDMARFDIYIVKVVGQKLFKRLVLSPHVFESYGHLEWGNIKSVDTVTMASYTTSDIVRCWDPDQGVDDPKVYELTPDGDTGTKQWLNVSIEGFVSLGHDWDSIYTINQVDRDAYTTGTPITQ